jgi:hypothetical protein
LLAQQVEVVVPYVAHYSKKVLEGSVVYLGKLGPREVLGLWLQQVPMLLSTPLAEASEPLLIKHHLKTVYHVLAYVSLSNLRIIPFF